MNTLCRDISAFLEGKGFENSLQILDEIIIISTKTRKGIPRTILPINLLSHSTIEAVSYSTVLQEHLDNFDNQLIIITEDRWNKQREMMQARLLAHLDCFTSIYARNCEIHRIDKATAKAFLEANHSYGDATCKYRYGLYLKRHTGHCHAERSEASLSPGTLVAVATFSNARKWIKGNKTIRSYEWTRYASLPEVRLSGGMGKVLKAFIKEVQPDDIMTYADLEWSEGNVYEQLGFTLEGTKNPVTFVIDKHWMRYPIKTDISIPEIPGAKYFQNFGSNKYRLKLTDYQ